MIDAEAFHSPPSESPSRHTLHTLLGAFALVLVVVLVGGYAWWQRGSGPPQSASSLASTTQEFALHQGVNTQWYRLSGDTLTSIKGPSEAAALPFDVIAIGTKTGAGTYPVLIRDPGSVHSTFGIANTNGSFIPIDASATFKEGLSVNASGQAVYASFIPASGVINDGLTASLIQGTASSTGAWHVVLVDLTATTNTSQDLGSGYGPHFLPGGSVLALGREGVVRIDPVTLKRVTLLSLPDTVPNSYAAAPDGSHFALAGSDGKTHIFAVSSASSTSAGVVDTSLLPLAFLSNGTVLAGLSGGKLEEYSLVAPSFPRIGIYPLITSATSTSP